MIFLYNNQKKYIESKIKKAIQLSVTYGVFLVEKSTKNRKDSDIPIEDEDFRLHPILTPYFQISWRKKQKCRFSLDEIDDFLFGTDECVSRVLEEYSLKTKGLIDDSQICFSDLKRALF